MAGHVTGLSESANPAIPGVVCSYPSGHVLEALAILGIITIMSWRSSRPVAAWLVPLALVTLRVVLAALARMARNAHYPSDVLGGLLGASGSGPLRMAHPSRT